MACAKLFRIRFPVWETPAYFEMREGHYRADKNCPGCSRRQGVRYYPASFELMSSSPVADFASGISCGLATEETGFELAERFEGLAIAPVAIYQGDSGERGKSGRKLRALKYNGPPLVELVWTHRLLWDWEQSTLNVSICPECGRATHPVEVLGVEVPAHDEKIGERWEPVPTSPREPGKGIIIPQSQMGNKHFVQYGDNRFRLCTEEVKDFIESKGWALVEFVEYGEVVPDGKPSWDEAIETAQQTLRGLDRAESLRFIWSLVASLSDSQSALYSDVPELVTNEFWSPVGNLNELLRSLSGLGGTGNRRAVPAEELFAVLRASAAHESIYLQVRAALEQAVSVVTG